MFEIHFADKKYILVDNEQIEKLVKYTTERLPILVKLQRHTGKSILINLDNILYIEEL